MLPSNDHGGFRSAYLILPPCLGNTQGRLEPVGRQPLIQKLDSPRCAHRWRPTRGRLEVYGICHVIPLIPDPPWPQLVRGPLAVALGDDLDHLEQADGIARASSDVESPAL